MYSNWFKNILTVSLLLIYINRGFFVAMPGIEMSCAHSAASNEVNSLLEIIMNWAGGHNELDEDGDYPESYNAAQSVQPLIAQNLTYTCLTCPCTFTHKIFHIFNEAMPSLDAYGTIDHPPEQWLMING
jgi:hypothetical protein